MSGETSDLKKSGFPSWIAVAISNAALIIGGAIGYGELTARVSGQETAMKREVESINDRLERIERVADHDRQEVAHAVEGLSEKLGNVQLDLARVCARLKCKE